MLASSRCHPPPGRRHRRGRRPSVAYDGAAEENISGRSSTAREEDRRARRTVVAGPKAARGMKREAAPPSLGRRPAAEGTGPPCSHQRGRQGPSSRRQQMAPLCKRNSRGGERGVRAEKVGVL
jgi:hypothetical protein